MGMCCAGWNAVPTPTDCRLVVLPLDFGRSRSFPEVVVFERERRDSSVPSSMSCGCDWDMMSVPSEYDDATHNKCPWEWLESMIRGRE